MLDARDLPDQQRLTAQVCIVGGGAAGITLALEFIASGIDVLLLESGGAIETPEDQALNQGSVVDQRLFPPLERYRRRRFGGSISEVEVRCTPLSEIELETRRYIADSGWPLSGETLAPYYPRALRLCEQDESARSYERDALAARQPLPTGFVSTHFDCETVDRYGSLLDFGHRYGPRLRIAANVCVLTYATVTGIRLNSSGNAVSTVVARTGGGKSLTIKASHFVLAVGALETARLLLSNRDVHRNGIGNDQDNVGRYLACPLQGTIGDLRLRQVPLAIWYGRPRSRAGVRSRRRLVLNASSQHQLRIGSFVARLRRPDNDPATNGRLLKISNIVPDRMRGASNRFQLDWQAEQQPNPSSRAMLDERVGERVDEHGIPRLKVDWHSSVADLETLRRAISLLGESVARSKAGSLAYDSTALSAMLGCHGDHGGHQLGTARMGADRRSSVVDENCRVHGVDNLYVAGGAVFPTSGAGDPTLTLIALTLRLADHLKSLALRVDSSVSPAGGSSRSS